MEVTLHGIVHALTAARANAELMAQQFPEYRISLLRFAEYVSRSQRQLLTEIRPELLDTGKVIKPR